MKSVSKDEANLISWLIGQVNLLEVTTGKKVALLELGYDASGGTGINLEYAPETEA